ncbi:PREDICTED: phosphatidylinositol 3-kinase 2-like [Rhagoletis zephyria]|uniref:phosphatidylinositol 3-kinase 2-like n=1 Tax=Rhagoletis zephyria TaxID=28612 RepID=UPI0008119BDC|nr:PREDICTED: phosphatidylinositol 3-kinase 2-like [Rhagoletis zephyria]
MSAAKMKTTPSATTATTDANERIRKHQQQQQHQNDNIANNFASAATATRTTSDTSIKVVTQLKNPPAAMPSTAAAATATTVVSPSHGGRRNHTRKLSSVSGDDLKQSDKRTTSVKRKRHVKFISTASNGSKQMINKGKSHFNATNLNVAAGSSLPPVNKTKSILKVKPAVVVKRKAGTNNVTKKLTRVPQGAQAEREAAELSKLAKQFARKLPQPMGEEEAQYLPSPNTLTPGRSKRNVANSKLLPARSSWSGNDQRAAGKYQTLNRRHSASKKHLPSGAGLVASGSVNVPAVRCFSPVQDKSYKESAKVYNSALDMDATKMFDMPTTSHNITVAMVKEEHAKPTKENDEQQQQVPNEATNSTTTTDRVSDLGGGGGGSGGVGGVGGHYAIEEMQNSTNAPVVVQIADPTARSSSNNSSTNTGVNVLPIRFLIRLTLTNV